MAFYFMVLAAHAEKEFVVVEGDLNKDGVADRVVVDLHNGGENFSFYFGDGKGGYSLFRTYESGLLDNDDVDITITDKGVLRIQKGLKGDCDVFLFRFQDGDFRLIGSKIDRHNSEQYDISHNYLNGKMVRTDGEGKAKKSVTTVMPQMPELKFGWFPLDFDALDYLFEENDYENQVEYKTIMGLFHLMQENGIFGFEYTAFDEYKIPYDDPKENADGSWSIYDEAIRPYVYTSITQLDIVKQEDGSYRIQMTNTFEDRSYEKYLDEGMELEEAMERAEKEKGAPLGYFVENEWLFKDGNFTLESRNSSEDD